MKQNFAIVKNVGQDIKRQIHTLVQAHKAETKQVAGFADSYLPRTAISMRERLNMRSKASMFASVSPTAAGSEPSHLQSKFDKRNSLTREKTYKREIFLCVLNRFTGPKPVTPTHIYLYSRYSISKISKAYKREVFCAF
jgi:hypothetical protein